MITAHPIRPVRPDDITPLVQLWHAGWTEAHAAHVPEELVRLRTPASFRERLIRYGDAARTAGPVGGPLGLCVIRGAEVDQLYVAPEARGSGLAAALLDDAATRIKAAGHSEAFLYCAPENARAAAFYARMGWRNAGLRVEPLETSEGPFDLPVLVFKKST